MKNAENLINAETEFRVEFCDVDSMFVVWHGNYMRYFEIARHALLKKIGFSYPVIAECGYLFPVASVSIKYLRSFHLDDLVRARATLTEWENCIKIRFELFNEDGELCTKGESTQMCVNVRTGESSFVCPKALTDRVEALLHT
jgi:acyl-CoA thioester hydrolase